MKTPSIFPAASTASLPSLRWRPMRRSCDGRTVGSIENSARRPRPFGMLSRGWWEFGGMGFGFPLWPEGLHSSRRHLSCRDQFARSPNVDRRPAAGGSPRRKSLHITVGVEFPGRPIDPAEAECFFDCIVIGNTRLAGTLLGIDQPDFFGLMSILLQPGAPLSTIFDVQGFHATMHQPIT
jgi:hypothetical protein